MYSKFIYIILLMFVFSVVFYSLPENSVEKQKMDVVLEKTVQVIGMRIVDTDGSVKKLGTEKGLHPIAIVFLDVSCPISNRYAPDLNPIFVRSNELQVDFYGVISDPQTSWKQANEFKQKYKLDFPLLFDASGDLAKRLKPTTVPQAFLVNKKDQIVYEGRIDNRFASIGKIRAQITSKDLLLAIESVAKTGTSKVQKTDAIGCIFEAWKEQEREVTYSRDVEPILRANCVECHHQKGIAPFSLTSYKSAKRRAKMMSLVTKERIMPPWRAKPGFGKFRDEHVLSNEQISLLEKWANSGTKKGNMEDLMPEVKFSVEEWALGKPDAIITMPEAFSVPASGEDIYRYFVIPSTFVKDKIIVGMDFRPGDSSVVHHSIYFADYSGRAREMDKQDAEPGFSVFGQGLMQEDEQTFPFGGWAPGAAPYTLPPGHAIKLPGGADIVLEIHYHLSGKETKDQSSLALYFAKEPIKEFVDGFVIGTQQVDIPANDSNYWRRVSMNVPADMKIIDISPHMHYIGKEVKAIVNLPDGTKKPLIHIEDWDFRWQSNYRYCEPQWIPKGSRIEAWFRYDNSADNPANPNSPPTKIKWGLASDDEMCELYFTMIAKESDKAKIIEASYASWILSADPKIAHEEWSVKQIIAQLKTASAWTPEGEEALERALVSPKAEEIFREFGSIAENSKDANIYANYGALLSVSLLYSNDEQEQYFLWLEADKAFTQALKQDPNHWDANLGKAVLYIYSEDIGMQNQAEKILQKLISKASKNETKHAKAYLYLGNLYEMWQDLKKAKAIWEEAKKIYPGDKELSVK